MGHYTRSAQTRSLFKSCQFLKWDPVGRLLSHHVGFHIAIATHTPIGLIFILSAIPAISHPCLFRFSVSLFTSSPGFPPACVVISTSLKQLQLFLRTLSILSYTCFFSYLLRLFHPKGVPWCISRALPRGKALLSTPLTLSCFQSRWCISVPGISRPSAGTECHRADAPVSYI